MIHISAIRTRFVPLWGLALLAGCSSSSNSTPSPIAISGVAENCMGCHNGSSHDDYAGPGMENPHPFSGAATLRCTTCHGGDPQGAGSLGSHVPPPPQIGDRTFQTTNARAYFNRLTLAGIDKFPDYTVDGTTYSALDYLEFVNPGDLRVVTTGRGCGKCHRPHAESTARAPLATEMGIMSSAAYTLGVASRNPASAGLYGGTGSDMGFRAVTDPGFAVDPAVIGPVPNLIEYPVFSVFGSTGPLDIFNNPAYDAANLASGVLANNQTQTDSPLANLFHEQISFTCGDCHLGSAGANNRYGDFRSSGCTACHMRYSQDGRSRISDPQVNKIEPLDPDDIDEPERPHVRRHLIASVSRTLPTGETVAGIDDHTCAGCHQGSNRTVLQYWGIRLDQNADVRNRDQYPANPVTFRTTAQDTRLYDPVVNNQTFNGRNSNQYLLFEDYDGDGRDDTPADVHYDAGLGCIDCHGSHDLHGGTVGDPADARIVSRQEQAVAIRCEDCHGTVDAYAATMQGTTYSNQIATVAMDGQGNPLRHVVQASAGEYYLTSRLTGRRHYIPQTRDVVVDSGKVNPLTGELLYSAKASYAMGRADNDPTNGIGPAQVGAVTAGFSHMDNMSCVACHASWSNSCIGCHLKGEYNTGNNFSNITGERIVYRQTNADFTYQTPVPFQLGVNAHNKIAIISPNTEAFYQWRDRNGDFSPVFKFTDRNGSGNNPNTGGRNAHPALSHNLMMPHSIRGKVSSSTEGPRYCVGCHLTADALANFGPQYDAFRTALANDDYASLDFNLLRDEIGRNPGNQRNSPFWVHMVSGLGSGLFLFDQNGCPVNPLDQNADRIGCNGTAPATSFGTFAFTGVAHSIDRIVESTGVSNGSNTHWMLDQAATPNLRDGALDSNFAGPLGATLIRRLSDPATGIILDSWLDADGATQGNASTFVTP